ncbi:uncharacterized protein LOC132204760 isoform X2 [Neocloeon triangulifer]|uniref:uncharacterized protein LOC132204760 isoform X2 n=1 Tax=Neocloeon triangulifer TaxID=2078957 RepID=UPI00286EC30E|nr:uncharacterized protein LOC132204760 isoform X2 [Neocloeon triangulifer]
MQPQIWPNGSLPLQLYNSSNGMIPPSPPIFYGRGFFMPECLNTVQPNLMPLGMTYPQPSPAQQSSHFVPQPLYLTPVGATYAPAVYGQLTHPPTFAQGAHQGHQGFPPQSAMLSGGQTGPPAAPIGNLAAQQGLIQSQPPLNWTAGASAAHHGVPPQSATLSGGQTGPPAAPIGNLAAQQGLLQSQPPLNLTAGAPAAHHGVPPQSATLSGGQTGPPAAPIGNLAAQQGLLQSQPPLNLTAGAPAAHHGVPPQSATLSGGQTGPPAAPIGNLAAQQGLLQSQPPLNLTAGASAAHHGVPPQSATLSGGQTGPPAAPIGNLAAQQGLLQSQPPLNLTAGAPAAHHGVPPQSATLSGGQTGPPAAPIGNLAAQQGLLQSQPPLNLTAGAPAAHHGVPPQSATLSGGQTGPPAAPIGNLAAQQGLLQSQPPLNLTAGAPAAHQGVPPQSASLSGRPLMIGTQGLSGNKQQQLAAALPPDPITHAGHNFHVDLTRPKDRNPRKLFPPLPRKRFHPFESQRRGESNQRNGEVRKTRSRGTMSTPSFRPESKLDELFSLSNKKENTAVIIPVHCSDGHPNGALNLFCKINPSFSSLDILDDLHSSAHRKLILPVRKICLLFLRIPYSRGKILVDELLDCLEICFKDIDNIKVLEAAKCCGNAWPQISSKIKKLCTEKKIDYIWYN